MNLILWIGGLFIFLGLLMLGYANYVYGDVTRADIDNLENQIENHKINIETAEKNIIEWRDKMNKAESLVSENKNKVRDIKRELSESWDALERLEIAEKELINSEIEAKKSYNNFIESLKIKSNLIKSLKELEKQFKTDYDELRKSNFDPRSYTKLIGVQLSNSCLVMLKNNINTTCPDYKDLRTLDTSIQDISGKFKVIDGFYQRDAPAMINSWRYYDNDPQIRIIVDPPQNMAERIKLIEIRPNFDTFLLQDDKTQEKQFEFIDILINDTWTKKAKSIEVRNQTQEAGRIVYHDRYVDDCKNAVINSNNWKFLLPDTIHYLRTDCTITQFEDKEFMPWSKTEHDITNSSKYKLDNWIKEIKENCLTEFMKCSEGMLYTIKIKDSAISDEEIKGELIIRIIKDSMSSEDKIK